MKGRSIVLDHVNGREAAALIVDGQLEDFVIASDKPAPGTVYRAIADRPIKGQGGMFLRTPDGSAFLRQIKGLAPGQALLVQVTGYPEDGKAIPVTQKLLFKSKYVIVTPGAPGVNISRSIKDDDIRDSLLEIAHEALGSSAFGVILRSSCAEADAEEIENDLQTMTDLTRSILADTSQDMEVLAEGDSPHIVAWREWVERAEIIEEPKGFDLHGVSDQLDLASSTRVDLGAGAFAFIEPTRALIAVDVNTGRDSSLAAGVKANLACAQALPRALRVKGLGGQIVLDLAPMPKKDRRTFETALRQSFRRDTVETALVGWTPLGHYELQRKRDRVPLSEVLG